MKPLIVFEMANNHMGDVEHGVRIIREFHEISKGNEHFQFAFKFQLRDIDTFVHPNFKNRPDLKYVKRFQETRLSLEDFTKLQTEAEWRGFWSICTAFDEKSVDIIREMKFDFIKIASCSFTDWPLLNKIADSTKMPIIASVAGVPLEDIDKVVSFFTHRNRTLTLLHCVGEYPTEYNHAQLNQIDFLKDGYPTIGIGWSTHEGPQEMLSSALALAKGAAIIEKHVGVETEKYKLNAYSIDPTRAAFWLSSCSVVMEMCGDHGMRTFSVKELEDLHQFKRGVFAKENIRAGDSITKENSFFAWPSDDKGVLANDMSKYMKYVAKKDIPKNAAILFDDVESTNTREKVWNAVQAVKGFLVNSGVVFPGQAKLELSHHLGIDKFYETGITMITVVNREYCKKLIVVLPGQYHPEQYHKQKEETFMVLYGIVDVFVNDEHRCMGKGEILTISPGQKHRFKSEGGCVIEELSSTHYADDSFYTDPGIQNNKGRKTIVNYWL